MIAALRTGGLPYMEAAKKIEVLAMIETREALEAVGNPTIAFLASGVEGIKGRATAKAAPAEAVRLLDADDHLPERRLAAARLADQP